jgi:hypothetical protein
MFDGKPIGEVIDELMATEQRTANEETDRRLSEILLTSRLGMRGIIVPRGPISIGGLDAEDKLKTYQLIWKYTPEKINNDIFFASRAAMVSKKALPRPIQPPIEKLAHSKLDLEGVGKKRSMTLPLYTDLREHAPSATESKGGMGSRESFLPALGHKVWEAPQDSPYDAYIFKNFEGKFVGYLRIPHYVMYNDSVEYLIDILNTFEGMTDMLILDQFNNPGGLLFNAFAVTSMLTDQTLQIPKQRMKISHAFRRI